MNAADNAEQLAAVAASAEEVFEKAQEQAQADSNLANESITGAEQATKQAEEVLDLAAAKETKYWINFPKSPSNELANADLPSAGMALNEVENALENQLEALENLQSGENPNQFPDTTENTLEEAQARQSSAESPENFASTEDAFDNSTPSRTLKSAKFWHKLLILSIKLYSPRKILLMNPQIPFPVNQYLVASYSNQLLRNRPLPGNPSSETFPSEPGEPIPGNGPGSGAGSLASTPSANQAIAQALQSLQPVLEAYAKSMAQQRTLMGDAKGNQLTSNDNEYQTTPVMDSGELPIFEKPEEEEDWGKLPPKLDERSHGSETLKSI